MTDLLLWSDPRPAPAWAHGGKAEALHELAAAGFDVPPFLALSDRLFRQHVEPVAGELATILAQVADGGEEEAGADLRGLVEGVDLDPTLRDALVATWSEQLGGGPVAVRSSAVGEDGAEQSFAGQHDSLLHVRDADALARAVVRCWSSAFTGRALAYRRLAGATLTLDQFRMGVVVQAMVDGDVSGVMFTVHPVSGDRDRVLINAVYGLGEGLVSGELDADSYDVHRLTGEVERELADKTSRVQAAVGGGVETVDVGGDRATASTLTDDQARGLAELGIRLQALRSTPQDVEWTLRGGGIVLLQSRPITALPPPPRREDPPFRRIWNNSNIVESYTGVTSPLTFSFARGNYEIVYRQFHQLVGVPADVMAANEDLYPNFLGLIRGRIYYNLMNIYRLVALLPGFQFNKPLLEQMMGLKEVAEYAPVQPEVSATRKYLVEFPKLARTALQFLYNIGTVSKRVPGFFALFDEVVEDHAAQDYRTLAPAAIAERYADLTRRLLWQWKVPIVNDFAVMIFYGVLRGVTGKWGIDDTDSLHHELLCGEGGLMSTEPAKAALRLAQGIRGEPALDRLFAEGDGDSLQQAYRTRTPASPLWGGLDDYLEKYGYRCVGELKLEETSLKDDPRMLLVSLQGYLAGDVPDPEKLDAAEQDKRDAAERKVAQALRFKPVKRLIYGWLLGKARAAVRDRENLRFCRTRIFGLTRDLFRGLGWQLYRTGQLAAPDDVFYLDVAEVFGFVEGTATCTDLRGLAAVRRAEFETFRAEPDPDDNIVTGGIPYHNNPLWGGAEAFVPAADGALAGTPCAPGRVKAPVRVVLSPRGEPRLDGEILVAARTDPGWVTLFPTAAGLLIERGSPLSHSAVVARELGIPAIVGIRGLTETLSSGDVVEMDGGTGRVEIG